MSEEQLIPTPSVFGETGNFLLERELGRGGMGGVYMGRDKMLDRPVAVKVMLKEYGSDPVFVEKFKKEAQAAARLIHPNIAQIYSYGIADGMPYIAMELVAGGSLDQIMRNSGAHTDIPRVMKICEQVAQALRCAADQGFVHGDVKPENVLLDSNGNAKLVDFGLAAMQKDTNEIWGTPYYIAPEKVKKEPVDYRADMYSLGGTLYHAICGVAPFEGEDATAVVRKRFEAPPVKPSEVRPGVSPQVDFLVMKMLALDPADRYPTFEALLEDFKRVMTSGLSITGTLSATGMVPGADPAAQGAASSGGKRVRFKAKRRMTATTTVAAGAEGSDGEDAEEPSGKKRLGGSKADLAAGGSEEEEDEGGVGGKVALVVGGVIGVIALVVGGLVWYQVADRKAREAARQADIDGKFAAARSSLEKTRAAAIKFADSMDAFADEAINDCRRPTKQLKDVLSARYSDSVVAMLHPGPTQELLDAIASTNASAQAKSAEAAQPAAQPAAQAPAQAQAQPAAAPAPAAAAEAVRGFPPPKDDEADPNSPEGQKYLEAKAKWEAEQKAKAAAAQAPAADASAPQGDGAAAEKTDASGKLTEPPAAVTDMAELWAKAYSCKACAIRVRKAVIDLVAEIDEVSKTIGGDEQTLVAFVDKANVIKEKYEAIKGSKEVATVEKNKGFINSRGKKTVDQTVKRLHEMEMERIREEAKKKREADEKARQEQLAKEKAERIEREIAMANERYEKAVADGKIRQLDWKGAIRMLDKDHLELVTAEGDLARALQIRKINCMKKMQDILVERLKGYTFSRGNKDPRFNLKGATVIAVDTDKITVQKKGVAKPKTIPWQTFCGQSQDGNYHNSLDELITRFILKDGAVPGTKRLSIMDRFEAMAGVTFILRIVCSDDPSAVSYSEKIIKEAVKSFPGMMKTAKEFFPDIDFSDVAATVENEQI